MNRYETSIRRRHIALANIIARELKKQPALTNAELASRLNVSEVVVCQVRHAS